MEPKLLTEVEARDLLERYTEDGVIDELRERGLIAPEPEADAFDVAVINALEADGWSFSTASAHTLAGALRGQGMELQREAQPALTVESGCKGNITLLFEQAGWEAVAQIAEDRGDHVTAAEAKSNADRLHAAITQPPHADKGVG